MLEEMDSRRRRTRGGEASGMDAELWGELQRYIDLKEIFAKLPFREFFQLRLVCKDWNRLASDRKFLEESFKDPIPKPYFVVTAYSLGRRKLACFLTYDASSSRWNSTRLPSLLDLYSGDLVNEGLLHSYCHLGDNEERVFNIHTRVFHALPAALQFSGRPDNPVPASPFPFRGMALDTSESPYTFQLILGESLNNPPQIYNSKTNSWTLTSSRQVVLAPADAISKNTCKRSAVYTRYDTNIMTYTPEEDTWFRLESPPGNWDTNRRSLGAWGGRLFDVTVDLRQRSITIWELPDRCNQEWKAFEHMSEDLYSWLTYADRLIPPLGIHELEIGSSYCSEYVLVYSSLAEEGLVERFVMCNLETKKWQKIDVGRLVHLPYRDGRRRTGHRLMRAYALPEFDESLLMRGY